MKTMRDGDLSLSKATIELPGGVITKIVKIELAAFGVDVFTEKAPSAEVAEISRRLTETRLQAEVFVVPHPMKRSSSRSPIGGIGNGKIELWAERAVLTAESHAAAGMSVRELWIDRRRERPSVLPVPLAPCDLLRMRSAGLALNEIFANGGYFLFEARELDTPFEAFGDPVGLVVANGTVLNPPQVRRACFCRTGNSMVIRDYDFSDARVRLPDGSIVETHRFGTFDAGRYRSRPVALARSFGAPDALTPPDESAFEVVIVGRHAVAAGHGGLLPIPRTGCVLRFPGLPDEHLLRQLQSGHPIDYSLAGDDVSDAVQTGPRVVQSGLIPTDEQFFLREGMFVSGSDGDLSQPSPASWKADWHDTRAARLGAGTRGDGSAFLLAIEGQSAFLSGPVRGATLRDLAEILLLEGAIEGIHLDGGGSTQVFRPYGGSLLQPGDFCKAFNDTMADYDRPLPLGLRAQLKNPGLKT